MSRPHFLQSVHRVIVFSSPAPVAVRPWPIGSSYVWPDVYVRSHDNSGRVDGCNGRGNDGRCGLDDLLHSANHSFADTLLVQRDNVVHAQLLLNSPTANVIHDDMFANAVLAS